LLALAFPDPDEDIRTYLLRYAAHFDVFDVQAYYLTFLGVLFTQVCHELDRLVNAQFNTHHDLAAWWRGHLNEGNNRANLYQSITRELGQEKISGHLRLRNGLVVCFFPYEKAIFAYSKYTVGRQTGGCCGLESEARGRKQKA